MEDLKGPIESLHYRCEWCSKPSGNQKFCCKKCQYDSSNCDQQASSEGQSTTSSSTSVSTTASSTMKISVFDKPMSFIVSELKHLLALVPVFFIHLALMNTEQYKPICQYFPTVYQNSPLDDGLSQQTNYLVSLVLSFIPLAIVSTLIFRFFVIFLWIVGIGFVIALISKGC
jgi:hypothetical protein